MRVNVERVHRWRRYSYTNNKQSYEQTDLASAPTFDLSFLEEDFFPLFDLALPLPLLPLRAVDDVTPLLPFLGVGVVMVPKTPP
jgi:hypothetical protein